MPTVEAPKTWRAEVRDGGAEWVLTASCPTCKAGLAWNVQPGPWRVPSHAASVELLGPDGHTVRPDEFDRFEQARAAGRVDHDDVDGLDWQLWCHRCQRGTAATLRT